MADYWGQRPADQSRPELIFSAFVSSSTRTAALPSKRSRRGEILYKGGIRVARLGDPATTSPLLPAGKVVNREFQPKRCFPCRATAVNQRREQFRDPARAQAIGLCFDFEWTRRKFFLRLL